jgi:hypothetical protein
LKISKGNQNPHIEEGQTTQCPKEKGQNEKQRPANHTHKTKDRVTRTIPSTEVDYLPLVSSTLLGGTSIAVSLFYLNLVVNQ